MVTLLDFKMPQDAPDGSGIEYSATTRIHNPRQVTNAPSIVCCANISFSPFELGLGTVVFNLTYKDVYLGLGTQKDTKIVSILQSSS